MKREKKDIVRTEEERRLFDEFDNFLVGERSIKKEVSVSELMSTPVHSLEAYEWIKKQHEQQSDELRRTQEELAQTQALLDNAILKKALGRIPETALQEVVRTITTLLVFPIEEEDGLKKIRVKIGEDAAGKAVIKWACGNSTDELNNSIVRIFIEHGLLRDMLAQSQGQRPMPDLGNIGKNGRKNFGEYAAE